MVDDGFTAGPIDAGVKAFGDFHVGVGCLFVEGDLPVGVDDGAHHHTDGVEGCAFKFGGRFGGPGRFGV